MFTIYHSPMARSCRIIWLAEEMRLEYQLETMALFSEEMTGQSYLEIHPLGKVPAIKDGDLVLWETLAIIEYLTAKYGTSEMLPPRDTPAGAKAVQWMEFGENQLTVMASEVIVHAADMLPEGRTIPALVERGKTELPKLIAVLENALKGHTYMVGDTFTAADIIMGFAVMIATHAGFVNDQTPLCQQYYARLEQRPAYQKAMAL